MTLPMIMMTIIGNKNIAKTCNGSIKSCIQQASVKLVHIISYRLNDNAYRIGFKLNAPNT